MQRILSVFFIYMLLTTSVLAMSGLEDPKKQLTDYIGNGKWTVVEIWSHACPSCKATIHELSDFDAISENYNAQVLGISLDGQHRRHLALDFVENHAIEFPNMLAEVTEVQQLIHRFHPKAPIATPTMMLFSPKGEFEGIVVGPVTMAQLTDFFEKR